MLTSKYAKRGHDDAAVVDRLSVPTEYTTEYTEEDLESEGRLRPL